MNSVDATVQYLLDKDAIRDLIYRYSLVFDLNRPEAIQDLLTEDAVIDVGPGRRSEGREQILAYQRKRLTLRHSDRADEVYLASSHHNANIIIEFESETRATVVTGCYAWHEMAETSPQAWGVYFDVVEKVEGEWLFKERVLKLAGREQFPEELRWHELPRADRDDVS